MNNDDDLLETNGLVTTNLFDIKKTKVINSRSFPIKTNDTKEYLNRNLYTRDSININHNLSQPWPVKNQKNDKPVISNTVADITENNYFKYNKSYVSVDVNSAFYVKDKVLINYALKENPEISYERFVPIINARYFINLNKTYNDIYKIKLVDFGIYNLSKTYLGPPEADASQPTLATKFTPYILLRVQAVGTKHFASQSNFEVASSELNEHRSVKGDPYMTSFGQLLTYQLYEPYTTSLGKIRFYKARKPVTDDDPIEYSDFIEPIFAESEIIFKEPIQNITSLLITIYDSEGNVYRSMQQHHFTLEITEKINVLKNTNINTKEGEIDVTGVSKNNPLLFN